jgi:hypothetical protein
MARKEVRAMNKVVLERYPVAKLPEELRADFVDAETVRLTVETEGHDDRHNIVFKPRKPAEFRGTSAGQGVNTIEGLRALRDEWE